MRNDPRAFDRNRERRSADRRSVGSVRRNSRRRTRRGSREKGLSLKAKRVLAAIAAVLVIAGIVVLISYLTRGTEHALPSIVLPTPEPTAEPAAEQQATTEQTQPEAAVPMTADGLPIL